MGKEKSTGNALFPSGLLLCLFYFIIILTFLKLIDFNGLYGQDSYEYLRYSKNIHAFITSGKPPGDYFWPVLYPITGALLSFIFSNIFALQFISVVSLLLSFYFLNRLLNFVWIENKKEISLYTTTFFILSPFILRASVVVMSDVFCLLFIIISFYAFIKYLQSRLPQLFFLLILSSAAACMTRYGAIVILALPIVYASFKFLKYFNLKYFILSIIGFCIVTLPHFIIRKNFSMDFIHHDWLQNWSLRNFFSRQFITDDGFAHYTFPNIIYSFMNVIHPGFLFAGIVFIFFIKRIDLRRTEIRCALITLLIYAFFLAGIPYQNPRFLILSLPFIIIILFPAYLRFRNLFTSKTTWNIFSGVFIVIQLMLFYRAFLPFYSYNRNEKILAQYAAQFNPSKTIYTHAESGALITYGIKNKVVELSSDEIKNADADYVMIVDEKQIAIQSNNKILQQNYIYLKSHCTGSFSQKNLLSWTIYNCSP